MKTPYRASLIGANTGAPWCPMAPRPTIMTPRWPLNHGAGGRGGVGQGFLLPPLGKEGAPHRGREVYLQPVPVSRVLLLMLLLRAAVHAVPLQVRVSTLCPAHPQRAAMQFYGRQYGCVVVHL